MKKLITVVACTLLVGNAVNAQQIKGDFDKQTNWGVQTSFTGPDPSFTEMGIIPDGWAALNVTQMGMNFPLVFGEEGRDGTGKCVKLMNRMLGAFGIGANSPSYITLGKSWVYADIMGVISQLGDKSDPDDSNGGSLGGIDFAFRPDSIVGFFKRERGEQNPNEIAQIIVYSWIGTSKSYSPIGDGMDFTENLPKVALIDRDVDILGIQNGGKPANGITLIGKKIYSIGENLVDWTRISAPIDYLRAENPMKMNVILTSADYFNRPNIGAENKLWVDDVRFVYNAKLKSITIDGNTLDGFDEDTMVYVLPESDASKVITAKAYGKSAIVTVGEVKDLKRTITVRDESAAGVKTYTYTIIYKGAPAPLTWNSIDPNTCVYGNTIEIKPVSANTGGTFSYEISNTDVAEIQEGNKIHFIGVGEIKITARQAASGNYSPSVSAPLTLTVKKAPLTIGVKDIERIYSFTADKFEFSYEGLKNNDVDALDNVFATKPAASILPQTLPNGVILKTSQGVYVGEYPVTVSNAVAPNYEITYKPGKLKVTPAAPVVIGIKAVNVDEGKDIPALIVDYSKLIGEDKKDNTLVFSKLPTLKTTAVKGSPVGTYDITFDGQGVLTETAKKNYQGISYAEKGTLTIKLVKTQPKFEDVVSDVKGLPEAHYVYAGHTDIIGRIEVYGVDNKVIDPALLTFEASGNNAFGIEKNGDYRLWGGVGGATGEVDITVKVKETETMLAVSKVVGHTKITKKSAIVKPMDFALSPTDFTGNMADYFPLYIKSEDILPRDLATFGIQGAFVSCPTLKIDTPDGVLELAEDPDADSDYMFSAEAVEKLHALPSGKYPFTVEGGSSTQYDCTFDNTIKGVMLVPTKSVVEIKGIDGLVYGRKESFKPEIKANGKAITEYEVTMHYISKVTNNAQEAEFNVLSPGTDTLTFVIPATETTLEETRTQLITVNKALLTVTPREVTALEGNIIIPETYELNYEGFVNDENESSLDVLPTAICQVREDAKAGEVYAIFLTGAEDDKYDFIYKEGKFVIGSEDGIIPENTSFDMKVFAAQGNLDIQGNEKAEPVAIYTIQGVKVAQYDGSESVISVRLVKDTIYIVKIGEYAARFIMR